MSKMFVFHTQCPKLCNNKFCRASGILTGVNQNISLCFLKKLCFTTGQVLFVPCQIPQRISIKGKFLYNIHFLGFLLQVQSCDDICVKGSYGCLYVSIIVEFTLVSLLNVSFCVTFTSRLTYRDYLPIVCPFVFCFKSVCFSRRHMHVMEHHCYHVCVVGVAWVGLRHVLMRETETHRYLNHFIVATWSQCSVSIVQTVKPIPKKTEEPQKQVEAPVEAEQEPEQEQGNMKLLAPPMIKPFHISLKDTDGKRKLFISKGCISAKILGMILTSKCDFQSKMCFIKIIQIEPLSDIIPNLGDVEGNMQRLLG